MDAYLIGKEIPSMDQRTLAPDLFRSPLIPAAACVYTLAALCGIPGIALFFDSGATALWYREMLSSGITSGLAAWRLIFMAVNIFACVCPAVMAAGLWLNIQKRYMPGMKLLSSLPQWLLHGTTVTGAIALAYLIFRAVRYIAYCATKNEGLYLLYTTAIPEAVMVAQAWFLWKTLRNFLECFSDTATSITYTLASGKLDSMSTPGFTGTGLLILAVFGMVIAFDRIFTVTIVYDYLAPYYKILAATHWSQYLSGAALFLGAIANILIFCFLRRYNRLHERALYYARKQKQ